MMGVEICEMCVCVCQAARSCEIGLHLIIEEKFNITWHILGDRLIPEQLL